MNFVELGWSLLLKLGMRFLFIFVISQKKFNVIPFDHVLSFLIMLGLRMMIR